MNWAYNPLIQTIDPNFLGHPSNVAPENRPSQKETIVFQPSIFRCYVGFREGRSYKVGPKTTIYKWGEMYNPFKWPKINDKWVSLGIPFNYI